jgi:hypothetical protein
MAFPDRIIPAVVHDDGSVHHSSVMSHESDTSCAVCYMVPMRIIPVIFVPGIMGSNLKSIDSPFERPQPIWTVNSKWSIGTQWGGTGAANRKKLLDPQNTEVDVGKRDVEAYASTVLWWCPNPGTNAQQSIKRKRHMESGIRPTSCSNRQRHCIGRGSVRVARRR